MTKKRPAPPRRSGREPSGLALDALGELRARLRAKPGGRSGPAGRLTATGADRTKPDPHEEKASPAHENDSRLLSRALAGVRPLADPERAVLESPKPPPLLRPQNKDAQDEAGTDRRVENLSQLSDAALLSAMMEGVKPIGATDRIDPGGNRRKAALRAPPIADPNERPVLLLPEEPEALSAAELFRYANPGTHPLTKPARAELRRAPPEALPLKRCEDEQAALHESLHTPISHLDRLETGDEAAFLRNGLPRRTLADLRRGRWVLQAELDLHGLKRDEARAALTQFLSACILKGQRCIRVIHGKGLGSPGRESVLKHLSRNWLAQREEILAFCHGGPNQGGSGALMVLLRGTKPGSR